MPSFKSCLAIINTRSGAREGLAVFASALQQYLDRAGIIHHDIRVPEKSVAHAIHELLPATDCLVVCGGDGTVSSVANVLGMTTETELLRRPIVVVPTGLQNSIAHSLSITSAERSVSSFVMGRVDAVPLWEVRLDGHLIRYVCSYVAVGTYARVVSRYHHLDSLGDVYVSMPMPRGKFNMAATYTALKRECVPCTVQLHCRSSAGPLDYAVHSPIQMLLAAQMPLQHGGYTLTPHATYRHRTLSATVATAQASRVRMLHLLRHEARDGVVMEEDGVQTHHEIEGLSFRVAGPGEDSDCAGGDVLMMLDGEPVLVPAGAEVSVGVSDRFLQFLTC